MEDSDFIFDDDFKEELEENTLEGDFTVGEKVLVNGEEFTITEFVEAKEVTDPLGFNAIYSWYKATNGEDEQTNLFFFDNDIDSEEKNDKVSQEWFDSYGE